MPEETTSAARLTGTKLDIVEAAQRTLMKRGFSGSSAREIAAEGAFNQALIFYHFNSVHNLLLAALDEVGARRMEAYGEEFEAAKTASELAALVRRSYAEDLELGYVAVLSEMVAAGMTDEQLGPQVAERLDPWIELVEQKLDQLFGGLPIAALAPSRDIAFALIATYLGVDMLSHLQRSQDRAEGLLDVATRAAGLIDAFAPTLPGHANGKDTP